MQRGIFWKWLGINGLSFALAFGLVFLLAKLFPETILALRKWWVAVVTRTITTPATGASGLSNFTSIILRNVLAIAVTFLIGLCLQAPLIMGLYGVFFSILMFTPSATQAAVTGYDWLLIAIEALFLLLPASAASLLATEKYNVQPGWKEATAWSIRGLTRFRGYFPKTERRWRDVFARYAVFVAGCLSVTAALLIFGAWFEVWGY